VRFFADRVDPLMIGLELSEDRPIAKSTAKNGTVRGFQGTASCQFSATYCFLSTSPWVRQPGKAGLDVAAKLRRSEAKRRIRDASREQSHPLRHPVSAAGRISPACYFARLNSAQSAGVLVAEGRRERVLA
jgi:hypothetical protein